MAPQSLTEYERRRLDNIRRNGEMMASLMLHQKASSLLHARPSHFKPQSKKPKPLSSPIAIRRSLRTQGLPPSSSPSDPPPSSPSSSLSSDQSPSKQSSLRIKMGSKVDAGGFDPRKSKCLKSENVARVSTKRILSLRFLPFGEQVVISARDKVGNVGFWDVGKGPDGVYVYRPHSGPVSGISVRRLAKTKSLNNLRMIRIKELERAKEGASVLSSKRRLRLLELSCTPQSKRENLQAYTEKETSRIEQVFDGLFPPSCIQDLWMVGFFGSRYPRWMSSTSVHSYLVDLLYLRLINCTSCPCLPSLGQLPHLEFLKIDGASAVVSIGHEFLGCGVKQGNRKPPTAFPKLEYLYMWNMPNWEEWSLTGEDTEKESTKLLCFPHLEQLSLRGCPKLRALPKDLDQGSIKELYIRGADSLEAVEDMPSLTELLEITDNKDLSRVSNLPALKGLTVENCPMLKNVEKLDSLQSLRFNDEKSNNLPEWLIDFLREKQQTFDDQFQLLLYITVEALEGCLRESPAWLILEQVPRISANATLDNENMYLKYNKATFSYDTNLHE